MKIREIYKSESEIVETDVGTFRRYSENNWEELMGNSWGPIYSWEPVFINEVLEKAYQLYKHKDE